MEVSVCRSPVPVPSVCQEPGGKRAPWWACGWGQDSAQPPRPPPLPPRSWPLCSQASPLPWPTVLSAHSRVPEVWSYPFSGQMQMAPKN